MLELECSETPPYGGLLSDDMGLGKTVQCAAVGSSISNTYQSLTK